MSGTFDKLLAKGKAKVKEFTDSKPSQQQGYSGQYQAQGYPAQGHPQYPGGQNQYQYQQGGPPQNQQWGAPQQQWGPPPPPQQQQQLQQSYGPPPIPQASKPHSPHPQQQGQPQPQPQGQGVPPPIPQNRPTSAQPPPPQHIPPPHGEKVYWRPAFDRATPVTFNFRHEIGDHGWGNNEKQMYTDNPANSFHHDNRLIIRGLVQGGSYQSARLTSHQTLSRPRGYLTATILPPVAEGIWPAYWLLPKDPFQWPNDGEVDIFESWNGDCVNHSCLHWGHYNGQDWNKHRVHETHLHDMPRQPHTFGFAWVEDDGIPNWRGRMIWYIDGRPVMKGNIPLGTRRMEEFRLMINIAMGGNVCDGKLPKDGYYDLVISDVKMCEEPQGGWQQFEHAWNSTPEGKTM
ncbi:concanavalin A-like lectin/glucanase domain-containing protein [Phaeosphaeriaceae sp. PMI808]|nr:concanavalin A-like lectin/glucanase domain-containing protein [Phaeosphaeriaceae sp. PMI808]